MRERERERDAKFGDHQADAECEARAQQRNSQFCRTCQGRKLGNPGSVFPRLPWWCTLVLAEPGSCECSRRCRIFRLAPAAVFCCCANLLLRRTDAASANPRRPCVVVLPASTTTFPLPLVWRNRAAYVPHSPRSLSLPPLLLQEVQNLPLRLSLLPVFSLFLSLYCALARRTDFWWQQAEERRRRERFLLSKGLLDCVSSEYILSGCPFRIRKRQQQSGGVLLLTGIQLSSTILSRSQQASLRPRPQTHHPPGTSVSACIFCNVCFLGVALRPSWVCRPSFRHFELRSISPCRCRAALIPRVCIFVQIECSALPARVSSLDSGFIIFLSVLSLIRLALKRPGDFESYMNV